MLNLALQYPVFGSEILCPHCQQTIPALTLTDTYLCKYHGPFEADPKTQELKHLNSGRHWKQWNGKWYRQHTHPDGLRFEIHEALDRLYSSGCHATRIRIAERYRSLMVLYFQRTLGVAPQDKAFQLYGLPIAFSDADAEDPYWSVINFDLETTRG